MSGTAFAGFYDSLQRMTLLVEEGQPCSSERTSTHARRLKDEGLDRDFVVKAHEDFRVHLMRQMSTLPFSVMTSLVQESPRASAPLSSLKVVTLPQLIVGKRHQGRVLHGRLCVRPFKMSAIISVLEDEDGRAARLTIYNVLPGTASAKAVEDRFPPGMRVIVKEPFFKLCVDGKTAIRVDNPADIVLDKSWKDQAVNSPSPKDSCDDAKLTEELEAIRCEGNELFSGRNWIGAVNKYSLCIDEAISTIGTKMTNKSTPSKVNKVVMLAYSNRAEARLRLGAFDDALSDANKALEFDPKHVKTLVRKGKAAHGLGLFEKSCTCFKAALDQSPEEESIVSNLKASTIANEQSRTGNYDLSPFFARGCTGDIPRCADFVGPVEIGRVHDGGCGRRGLFATKKVEPGQVILVSNPLAIVRQKSDVRQLHFDFKIEKGIPVVNSRIQQDFVGELANRIMKSKRQMAQVYSLASYGKHEMEIPSMDLFRSGSEWVPPGTEKLEVDMSFIRDIAKVYAIGDNADNFFELVNRVGKHDYSSKDVASGIWLLPSFANHSCAPNCLPTFIGDTMFFYAAIDIMEGEELTIPYFIEDLFEGVATRQAMSLNWLFTCKCERCLLEESLKPQLLKISKVIPDLMEAAEVEIHEGLQKRRAAKELAKVADEVEAVIQNRDVKLKPRQQSWVRAAFLAAYFARFRLTMDEHDSQARIASLRLIVDSMASVCVTPNALGVAAMLLQEVEERYFKHSHSYRLTLDRVLGIYRIAFGKQPNNVLHKLIRARQVPRDFQPHSSFN